MAPSLQRLRCKGDGDFYLMDLAKDTFVHFTPPERAEQILQSGKLLMDPPYKKFGIDAVTAVSAVWGKFLPGVQTTHSKRDDLVAVVFKTRTIPQVGYPEEVIWKRDVDLVNPKIVSYSKGKGMLRSGFDGQVYYSMPSWCDGVEADPKRVAARKRPAPALPRWMKGYRAVDAGRGIMTDAVRGGIYFFPKRETAELWAGRHGHVIERLIRTDTASVVSSVEGELPYHAGETEDVIVRTDPRGSGKVLEIIVFNKAFIKAVDKSAAQGLTSKERNVMRVVESALPTCKDKCWIATEVLYHLLDGKRAGYEVLEVSHEGSRHWFLRTPRGAIIDVTASQFDDEDIPYGEGRPRPGSSPATLTQSVAADKLIASNRALKSLWREKEDAAWRRRQKERKQAGHTSASRVAARYLVADCNLRTPSHSWIDPKGKVHLVPLMHDVWAEKKIRSTPSMLRSFVKRYREYYPDELYELDHPWTGFLVDQGWVRVANFLNFEGRDHLVSPHAWESAADLIIDCVVKKQLDPETTVVTVAGYGKQRYSVSQIVREWGGSKAEDRLFGALMARTAREDLVKEVIDPSKVKFKIRSSSDAVAVEMRYGRKRIGQMIANKVRYPEEQDCPRDVTVLAKRFPELVTGEWKRSNGEVWRYITALSVYKAFITEDEFRGYGLGKKMYKALMGAWFKEVGPFLFMPYKCDGGSGTSPDAMRVWHSLAKEFPSSGDVVAVMKNPRVARGQLPQYRKRAHTPDSSEEVENWVDDFGRENNYTPGTCDLNRGDCDMMSNVFADWFEDQTGEGLQIWGGQGFIPPLGKDANDLWVMLSGDKAHKKGEKPLSHVVVVWGDWVIDLTGRQFGSKYKAPVYSLSEFKKRWATVGKARRADRGINNLRRMMLQNSSDW